MKVFKNKHLYIYSLFIAFLLYSCGQNKIIGHWFNEDSNIILEINKNELTFKIPEENHQLKLNYENKNDYLYFTNELKLKDSIKVIQASKDTLVLALKEKGKIVRKTFIKK
ncbi:hypothetical protein CW751_11415 [Brumimicrobium salinarum]|uniref:Lipoprotein n=1 Tax=Brumimicrobium salinarum TaxID=2058658 RepID=A0A2I0R0I6_9FLAO|nr:hypothetical protein [Brumimicrobium salinarum]PKR80106.1 hypothetical protein CW751_11415 [Brumimicrobium salinarum]